MQEVIAFFILPAIISVANSVLLGRVQPARNTDRYGMTLAGTWRDMGPVFSECCTMLVAIVGANLLYISVVTAIQAGITELVIIGWVVACYTGIIGGILAGEPLHARLYKLGMKGGVS